MWKYNENYCDIFEEFNIFFEIFKKYFYMLCVTIGSWELVRSFHQDEGASLVSAEQHIWGWLDLRICWTVTSQCACCCIHFFVWFLNINLKSSDLFTHHLPLWSHLSGTLFWYHFLPPKRSSQRRKENNPVLALERTVDGGWGLTNTYDGYCNYIGCANMMVLFCFFLPTEMPLNADLSTFKFHGDRNSSCKLSSL